MAETAHSRSLRTTGADSRWSAASVVLSSRALASYTLEGHTDTITGLSVSPDGSFLLSNSMDNTLRSWDVRPFVNGSRAHKSFAGVQHNFQKTLLKCGWSADGTKVSAGSSDQIVSSIATRRRSRTVSLGGAGRGWAGR